MVTSNELVWTCWTGTSSSTVVTSNSVWTIWASANSGTTADYGSTTSGATTEVWLSWNVHGREEIYRRAAASPQPTAEELAEQERRRAEWRAQEKKRQEEIAIAEARAEELLVAHLTEEQAKSLKEQSAIVVKSETGKQYRVPRNRNVEELDEKGEVVARYCIHPREYVPSSDEMLAHKLMLEAAEADFLRIANRTPARRQ